MQIINLYRYIREEDRVTVSPIEPEVEYILLYRLIADESMLLTNGTIKTSCIDVESVEGWSEIEDPDYRPEGEGGLGDQPVDENEATIEDYQNALREVGVNI